MNNTEYLESKLKNMIENKGLLNDIQIVELCKKGMITPYVDKNVNTNYNTKVISYGVSSFGYDLRIAPTVKVFKKPSLFQRLFKRILLDPKDFDKNILVDLKVYEYPETTGSYVILPPYSFSLGHTIEVLNIPDDIMCVCTCKSTLARIGLNINITTFEPSFFGDITLELTNPTPYPIKLYLREGIAQVLFFRAEKPSVNYASKNGKYQNQSGVTGAIV